MRRVGDARGAPALAAVLLTAARVPGCAYYNILYNAKQKYREAQTLKKTALQIDPERTKIGTTEERLYVEAFEKSARVVRFYPDSKWVDDALLLMAAVSSEKGDYTTAIRKCDELIAIFPNSNLVSRALLTKGTAHIGTREFEAARTALLAAREAGEKDIRDDVVYYLGVVEQEEGRVDEAKTSYGAVLEKHGDSEWVAKAGIALGDIQLEEGDLAAAVRTYERVRTSAKLREERFEGGLRKGKALLENGQFDRARTTFEDLAKRAVNEKQRGQALILKGRSIQRRGDEAGAFAVYREILEKMPRTEAAAEAQLEIAKTFDDAGDYVRAKEEYEKVNEQGTGFPAWRTASERVKEVQTVLDLRTGIDNDDEKEEEIARKRFLLAEQYLEKIGDEKAALGEYASLADDARGTEIGARALFAEAWLYENRFSRPDTAEVLLHELARTYRGTPMDLAARRRLGLPIWTIEKPKLPAPRAIRPANEAVETEDAVVTRVEPRPARLPEGAASAKVWVRVRTGDHGEVVEAKVSKSANEDCDAAALEAAKATVFRPVAEGGPEFSVLEFEFPPKSVAPPAPAAPPGAGASAGAGAGDPAAAATGAAPGAGLSTAPVPELGDHPEGEPPPALVDSAAALADSALSRPLSPADSARAKAGYKPPALRDRPIDPSTAD